MGDIYSQDWSEFVKEDSIIPSVENNTCDVMDFISSFGINYSYNEILQYSLGIY